ncbi:hypothetical protein HK405_004884, partial [Cladochytrium tenue]
MSAKGLKVRVVRAGGEGLLGAVLLGRTWRSVRGGSGGGQDGQLPGGLRQISPLPDEHDQVILDDSDPQDTRNWHDHIDRESDESSIENRPAHAASDDPEKDDPDDIVHDILRRHFDWDQRKAELDDYMKRVKSTYASNGGSGSLESKPPLAPGRPPSGDSKPESEEEVRIKILRGFHKIRQLDSVLKEKEGHARASRARILGTETVGDTSGAAAAAEETSPVPSRQGGRPGEGDDDDDDEFELRSIHSSDAKTFVTEPTLERRRLQHQSARPARPARPVRGPSSKSGAPGVSAISLHAHTGEDANAGEEDEA